MRVAGRALVRAAALHTRDGRRRIEHAARAPSPELLRDAADAADAGPPTTRRHTAPSGINHAMPAGTRTFEGPGDEPRSWRVTDTQANDEAPSVPRHGCVPSVPVARRSAVSSSCSGEGWSTRASRLRPCGGGEGAAPGQGVSHERTHSCVDSHQLKPADPMHPSLLTSQPTQPPALPLEPAEAHRRANPSAQRSMGRRPLAGVVCPLARCVCET